MNPNGKISTGKIHPRQIDFNFWKDAAASYARCWLGLSILNLHDEVVFLVQLFYLVRFDNESPD